MSGDKVWRVGLLRAVALAAGLALVATACGSDESDEPATASTDTDTAVADSESESGEEPAAEEPATADEGAEPADAASEPSDEPAETDAEEPAADEPAAGTEEPAADEPAEPEEPAAEEPMVLTASWRGVTEDSITIGVSMLNFDLLKELGLSQAGWGDQEGIFQAFVDDLNANGGIHGRMLVPVYDYYSPISGDDATRSCTVLTQDHEVFAVLLGFVGPLAGTADPCIVGTNATILVGGEHTPSELEQAQAPWFNVEPSTDSQTDTLLDLLIQTGRADGARVYVVSHQSAVGDEPRVLEALDARGFDVAGNAILDANDGDTAAQDSLMQIISERIRSEGANSVLINGNPAAIIRGLGQNGLTGSIAIWSNNEAGLNNMGATFDHEVARAAIASGGPSDTEIWNDPLLQECVSVVRAAIPEADLRPPAELTIEDENWFNPVRRYCGHLSLFVQIAMAAGADLTHETFEAAAHTLTDFPLPGVSANSLSPTKLGARDLFRLSEFDPDMGNGQTVPLTDLIDIFP